MDTKTQPSKQPSSSMIYVSNLPFTTTDEQLRELLKGFEIKTAYIAKRRNGRSKGFGFVNLANNNDQKGAIEKIDGTQLEGRKLTAKIAFNDERRNENGELKEEFKKQIPQQDQPSETVVYVSNLPWSFKDEDLKKVFPNLEVKVATVATRRNGRSKGFGFVEFNTKEDQQKALELDQQKVEDRVISVKPSISYRGPNQSRPQRRPPMRRKRGPMRRGGRFSRRGGNNRNTGGQGGSGGNRRGPTENTLYVSNLPFDLDDNDLKQIFSDFHVKSAHIATRRNGRSKGFGFVEFNNSNDQQEAMKALDQSEVNTRVITVKVSVGRTQNNNQNRRPQRRPRNNENREPSTTMVYVSNLPFSVDDNQLSTIFKGLKVSKAYVATRRNGRSKGFGFVDLQSTEEQQKALKLSGTEVNGRPLLVQIAKKVDSKTPNTQN